MKLILLFIFSGTIVCIRQSHMDAFDDSMVSFTSSSADDRGWDETNDYDREMERPDNQSYDDGEWKDFKESFNKMQSKEFGPDLNEKELIQQIGNASLGNEIR